MPKLLSIWDVADSMNVTASFSLCTQPFGYPLLSMCCQLHHGKIQGICIVVMSNSYQPWKEYEQSTYAHKLFVVHDQTHKCQHHEVYSSVTRAAWDCDCLGGTKHVPSQFACWILTQRSGKCSRHQFCTQNLSSIRCHLACNGAAWTPMTTQCSVVIKTMLIQPHCKSLRALMCYNYCRRVWKRLETGTSGDDFKHAGTHFLHNHIRSQWYRFIERWAWLRLVPY